MAKTVKPQSVDLSHKIAIVIITFNRVRTLTRTLEYLYTLPEKCRIVVVDNNSSDSTVATVRQRFPDVKLIPLHVNAGAIGRNIGVKAAGTPYIAFCDDDSWWEPGALNRAVDYFERYKRVGALAGKIYGRNGKLDYVSYLQSISPLTPVIPIPGTAILSFLGCGVFVRRSAFEEAGGYNTKIKFAGEEFMLAIDMLANGWGSAYVDDVVGHHHAGPRMLMFRRNVMGVRNHLWFHWLRRKKRYALAATWKKLRTHKHKGELILGALEALTGIPYVIRHRHVIPDHVEAWIQELDAQNDALNLSQSAAIPEGTPTLAGMPV